jgi:hypothetical protein
VVSKVELLRQQQQQRVCNVWLWFVMVDPMKCGDNKVNASGAVVFFLCT